MFILTAIGLIAGAIAVSAVLTKYWERITNWLNNEAADAVERALSKIVGQQKAYTARRMMHKAISVADRVYHMVNGHSVATNIATVYTKRTEGGYNKVVMLNDILEDEFGQAYVNEFKNADNVMQLDYKQ